MVGRVSMRFSESFGAWRRLGVLAAILCAAIVCLSASTSSGRALRTVHSHKTPASVVAAAKKAVSAAYGSGGVVPPPTKGPRAQKGKTVWWISCGQIYPSCVSQSQAFQAAAKVLGWHVTVVDGKASSTTATALIRQAIAAHVDGIGVDTYDCPGIKGALENARAAHIPTVSFAGYDCNSPIYKGKEGKSLYTAVTKLAGEADPAALFSSWGKMLGQYIIARNNGSVSFFYVTCTNNTVCTSINNGFQSAIKPCTGCHEISVPYSFADVPSPATQQWKSALLNHPTVTSIQFVPAGLLADGLQTAISGSGRTYTLYGGEGSPQDYSLIRQGKEVSSIVRQDAQGIWAAADTLNRIFAGQKPSTFPNEGGGFQIVDKTHNLPKSGLPAPARNYQAAYTKLWTGK